MKNILFIIAFLSSFTLFSQVDFRNNYDANAIPTDLLPNADAVVRHFSVDFKIKNKGEATEEEHRIVTILNEKAAKNNAPVFYYDKIQEIEDIEANVYDSKGKLVRKIKKKDILDFKPYDYYVNDTRAKKIEFPRLPYPYTVEYKVKTKHKGLMFYPYFMPQRNENEAVINANFSISSALNQTIRTKEINVPKSAKQSETEWKFTKIKAFKEESFTPVTKDIFPIVFAAPTDFSIEGYDGNMESWKNFGKFIYQLNSDRNELPAEFVAKLKAETAHCKDIECKIKKVYEILQNSTRYFFVGLGIGGWQPAPATEVHNFKYGDCKGLSNYTVAMLNAIDVPARYVLIRAGKDNLSQYQDFPNPYFNHAIACVPMEKDTIWLECTSQTESCGFLSNFTDNRHALIITPEGGTLVKTPKYDEKTNKTSKKTTIKLNSDGSATLTTTNVYSGVNEGEIAYVAELNETTKKEYLNEMLDVSDFELKEFSFERKKDRLPTATEKIILNLPNFASVSGKRIFLPTNVLSKWRIIPFTSEDTRRNEVQADARGFTQNDEIIIELPNGYKAESGLQPIKIESVFGKFTMTFQLTDNQLVINRNFILNNSIQPKEKYNLLIDFFKNIIKNDKENIVLVK